MRARSRRKRRRRATGVAALILLALTACACAAGVAGKLIAERKAAAGIAALQERVRTAGQTEIVVIELANGESAADTADSPQPTPTSAPTLSPEDAETLAAYAQLQAENGEFAGWIRVPDTQADCPVMYSPDRPQYYYQRDFDGKSSKRGMIFIDESSAPDARNVLIYGHNMKSGSMFGELDKYLDESFALSHMEIRFDTVERLGTYRVISVYQTTVGADDSYPFYAYAGIRTDEELAAYGQEALERSLFDFGGTVSPDDRLLTLVTCNYYAKNGRLILVAKRVGSNA